MQIVTVMPLKKGGLRGELSYFSLQEVEEGSVVSVNIRGKTTLGLVLSSEDAEKHKSEIKNFNFNLKKVASVSKGRFFRKAYIDAVILTAKYFAAQKNDVASALFPVVLRAEYDTLARINIAKTKTSETKNLKSEKLLFQTGKEERVSYYKTLIRASFAQKKSVFIVLPTEHDIATFYNSLVRGIEKYTFTFHSGLAEKKILENIKGVLVPEHPVLMLGTAPFLSIPREDLGTVVLEGESSSAYRTHSRPHLDLRIFIEIFADKARAKLIVADTILRLETVTRKDSELLPFIHQLNFRTEFAGEIKISVAAEGRREKWSVLNEESIDRIRESLAKGRNVLVFSLRKGLATNTVCRDCESPLYCERCSAPIVLYTSNDGTKRMFVCNHCRRQLAPETKCPQCLSWNLFPIGIGTDTTVNALKESLGAKAKIFKLDKESVKTTKAAKALVKKFESERGAILVATEMAFYHLNEKIPLSVIASFDSLWSIPHYKMGERILRILLSLEDLTLSTLLIQTKNKDDATIRAVLSGNVLEFVRDELRDRKAMHYPPYLRFIKITHLGDKEATMHAKEILRETFREYSPEIFSGFVARLKGKFVTNALIKIEPYRWSLPEILHRSSIDEALYQKLIALPPNFTIIVDPEDLL